MSSVNDTQAVATPAGTVSPAAMSPVRIVPPVDDPANYARFLAWQMEAHFPLLPIRNGRCICKKGAECMSAGKCPAWAYSKLTAGEKRPIPPGCGYGIATGSRSGFFVVDLDVKPEKGVNGIVEFFKLAAAAGCPIPVTHKTESGNGRGGVHLRFRLPAGFTVKNSQGKLGPGIDVRGEGGFIVGPGSPHKSGGVYTVIQDAPIADAPAWLLEALQRTTPKAPPAPASGVVLSRPTTGNNLADAATMLRDNWPASRRHLAQLALVGACVRGGWSDDDIVDFVTAVCGERAKREQTVADTRAKSLGGEPYTGFDRLKDHVPGEVVDAARKLMGLSDELLDLPADFLAPSPAPVTIAAPASAVQLRPAALSFSFGGWDATPAPVEYVIDGLITRASVNLLVAHGDSMKTWTLLSMILSIAGGAPWLGRFPVKKGRVAFLDYENGRHETHRRIRLLTPGGGSEDLGYAWGEMSLADPRTWEVIAALKLDVLGIDSLAAGSGGVDENDASAARPLQYAKQLAETVGTSTLSIHHARKSNGQTDAREAVRGSSAIFAACDSVFRFSNEPGDGKVRMYSIKTRQGRKPAPVNLRLSDAEGLAWFEDVARDAAAAAETPDALMVAIQGALMTRGTASGVKELALWLGKREGDVRTAVGVLLDRGAVAKRGKALYLDTPGARRARVLKAISEREADEPFTTPASLARAAEVMTTDIDRLERERVILNHIGRYIVLPAQQG